MGRITVFSSDGCPHCIRTKAALTRLELPYTEISVTRHPLKRKDMHALSQRFSTPQVFFNTRHIGGADDTLALLHEWESNQAKYPTAKARYEAEIAAFPDPVNPRFEVPEAGSDSSSCFEQPRKVATPIVLPNGTKTSIVAMTEELLQILPRKDNFYKLKKYRHTFTGAQAVEVFQQHYGIDEETAIDFGLQLQAKQMLDHVYQDHPFAASTNFFHLHCDATPDILNSYCVWSETADVNSLVRRLMTLMQQLEAALTNEEGKIDYKGSAQNDLFPVFEFAVCELQTVDLASMDDATKTAFGVNLYNLMIKYAFMKVGAGTSEMSRSSFFSSVKFLVGGHTFSFQDWENGILRGNRKAPYSLSPPLGKKDPRLSLVVQNPDPRIHFGLNCGAKSCPPVNRFTLENLEEELDVVAAAFCEDNVEVDTDKRELRVSKIFSWYRVDFAPSTKKLPAALLPYLRGTKKQALERLLFDGGSVKVTFMEYDWSTNASDIESFDASSLKVRQRDVRLAVRHGVETLSVSG